ncbi:MAG: retroviral-like aspartic protease family protein [Caldilineae bacterium]|nr:retroviral-like aspartic protease family protein [Caldilineae bacterium]
MNVVNFIYGGSYYPPAPVVDITVRGTDPESSEVRMKALIDTGADASMLPLQALQAVGAKHMETRFIRGITGARQAVETYLARVKVGSHVVVTADAIALAQDQDAILGRDVLNQLTITLDGPALIVEIAE